MNERLHRELIERISTEEALQKSEERFRTLIEEAPIAIALSREGKFLYANPAYYTMHGMSSTADVIGHSIYERVAPESIPDSRLRAEKRSSGDAVEKHYEYLGLRQDGSLFPVLAAVTSVSLADGPATIGFFQDITEPRHREKRVERLSGLYAVLSRVNESIVRVSDKQALYTDVCRIVVESGFPLAWIGEISGQQVLPVAWWGSAADYLKEIKIDMDGNHANGLTATCIRAKRAVVVADFASDPGLIASQAATARYGFRSFAAFPLVCLNHVIGTLTLAAYEPGVFDAEQVQLLESLSADVSYALDSLEHEHLRLSAEEALQISEQRYRSLFDGMTEGFGLHEIICNEKGQPVDYRFLEDNAAFERLTGLKRSDVIGRLHNELLLGDDPYWLEIYGAVALSGSPVHFENYSPALKQHYEVFAYRPAPNQFAVLFMNITQRKQVEEDLRRSQQKTQDILESIQDGFMEINRDWRFTYLNKRAAQNVRNLPEELVGKNIWEEFPQIVGTPQESFYRQVMEQRQPAKMELEGVLTQSWYEIRVYPSPLGITVFWADIERKQMEAAIRQSETRYRSVVSAMYEGVVLQGASGAILAANASAEKILGLTSEQMLGRTSTDPGWGAIHPNGTPFDGKTHPAMVTLRTGEPMQGVIMRVHKPNGKLNWISINSQPMFNPGEKNPYAVVTTFIDITEKKKAEDLLRKNCDCSGSPRYESGQIRSSGKSQSDRG